MPPKKPAAPGVSGAAAQEADGDYVAVRVDVQSACLKLVYQSPTHNRPADLNVNATPISTLLEIKFADESTSTRSASKSATDSVHQYGANGSRRYVNSPQLINQILNNLVTVNVIEASSDKVIASTTVDLLELAVGATSISRPALTLAPVSQGCDVQVKPGSTVELTVQLERRDSAAAGEAALPIVPASEQGSCSVMQVAVMRPASSASAVAAPATAAGYCATVRVPVIEGTNSRPGSASAQPVVPRDAAAAFPGGQRCYLSPKAIAALKAQLEAGKALQFDLARCASSAGGAAPATPSAVAAESAADRLPALLEADCSELLEPGCTELEVTARAAANDPPQTADARPTTAHEPSTPQPSAPVTLILRLTSPLVPPLPPLPCPTRTLQDLVPPRRPAATVEEPTAVQAYLRQVQQLAAAMAQDTQQGASGSTGASSSPESLLRMQQSLKSTVVSIAKMSTAAGLPASEQAAKLYTDLVANLHTALQEIAARALEPAKRRGTDDAAYIASLARDVEFTNDLPRAESLFQQYVSMDDSAEAWYRCGSFYMRTHNLRRAAECFRQSLALEPGHIGSLTALLAAQLQLGSSTEPAALGDALVLGHDLRTHSPAVGLALLVLVYRAFGKSRDQEARTCQQEVLRLHKSMMTEKSQSTSSGYIQAAELLLDLQLPALAQQALALSAGLKVATPAERQQHQVASVRAAHQCGQTAAALDMARALQKEVSTDAQALAELTLLMAEMCFEGCTYGDALQYYRQAAAAQPQLLSSEVLLRMASCAVALHQHDLARSMYLRACELRPSAAAWLGAALAMIQQQQWADAEMALCEASTLDQQNPTVWGHAALVALKQNNHAVAEQALMYARRTNLEDTALLTSIAAVHEEAGQTQRAIAVLELFPVSKSTWQVQLKIGQLRATLGDVAAAQKHMQTAVALCDLESDKARVLDQCQTMEASWPAL